MEILFQRKEIEQAQHLFEQTVLSTENRQKRTRIGYLGGHLDTQVYWLPKMGLWAYFGSAPARKAPGKYWNAFGLGKPKNLVNITCEINPPVEGIDRRPSGAFGRSKEGLYVLHRGKFNYRGGIPKKFTTENFDGEWIPLMDGDRCTCVLRVGRLTDRKLVKDLRDFVQAVNRLKEARKAQRAAMVSPDP